MGWLVSLTCNACMWPQPTSFRTIPPSECVMKMMDRPSVFVCLRKRPTSPSSSFPWPKTLFWAGSSLPLAVNVWAPQVMMRVSGHDLGNRSRGQ